MKIGLSKRMLFSAALVAILPCLLVGALISPMLWNSTRKSIESGIHRAINLQVSYLESYIAEAADTARFTAVDENVLLALQGDESVHLEPVKQRFDDTKRLLYYIDNVMLLDASKGYLAGTGSQTDALVVNQHSEDIFASIDNGAEFSFCIVPDSASQRRLYLTVPVKSGDSILGYVVESINDVFFLEFFSRYTLYDKKGEAHELVLIDKNGGLFSQAYNKEFVWLDDIPGHSNLAAEVKSLFNSNKDNGVLNYTVESKKYMGFYRLLNSGDFAVISMMPQGVLTDDMLKQTLSAMGIALLIGIISAGIVLIMKRKYADSLKNIAIKFRRLSGTANLSNQDMSTIAEIDAMSMMLDDMILQAELHEKALFSARSTYTSLLGCVNDLTFEYSPESESFKLYIPQGYGEKKSRPLAINENTTLSELIPSEEGSRLNELIIRSSQAPYRNLTAPFKMRIYDGIHTNTLVRWMSLVDEYEKIRIVGAIVDVERVQSMERRLADTETKYHFAIETMSDIFYEVDVERDTINLQEHLWYSATDVPLIGGYKSIMSDYREKVNDDYVQDFDRMIMDIDYLLSKPDKKVSLDYVMINSQGNYTWVTHTVFASEISGDKVTTLIGNISNANDRKKREMEEMKLARIDQVTRAYNSMMTSVEFTKTLMAFPDSRHAMLLVEVDDFDEISNKYGRRICEEILRRVVMILWQYQHGGFVGRLNNDLFALCIPNVDEPELVENSCREILTNLNRTVVIHDTPISIKVTIGVSLYPENGISYDKLYKYSNHALERAKENGRNQFVIYDKDTM